jgi:hypothetical protein
MKAAHVAFESLRIGQSAELSWSVSAADIDAFAALSGGITIPSMSTPTMRARKAFPIAWRMGFCSARKYRLSSA